MNDCCFTPTSAREALQGIRCAAERLCEIYRKLEKRCPRSIQSDDRVEPAYFSLVEQLHAFLGEIGTSGVQVRDLKRGLLEFPARRAGRRVLLSWEVGEPSLDYWHEADAGREARRPIDDDGPWEEAENPGQSR